MDPRLKDLEKERGAFYGDPEASHRAIGLAWEGVMRNYMQTELRHIPVGELFPAWVTALLLAAFKVVRAARPIFRQDSYDDGHVFLDFSCRFRQYDEKRKAAQEYERARDAAKIPFLSRAETGDREVADTPRPSDAGLGALRGDLGGGIRGGGPGGSGVDASRAAICPGCGRIHRP